MRSSRTSVAANHGTPLYLSAFSLHDALPLIVQPWARVEQRQHRATPRQRQKEKECLTGNRGSVSQPSGTFSRPLGYTSKNVTFSPLSFTFLLALCSFLARFEESEGLGNPETKDVRGARLCGLEFHPVPPRYPNKEAEYIETKERRGPWRKEKESCVEGSAYEPSGTLIRNNNNYYNTDNKCCRLLDTCSTWKAMFVEYMILRCKVKNRRGKRERRTKGEDARGEALKSRSEPPLPGEQVPGMVIHRVFTELKTLSSTDRERSVRLISLHRCCGCGCSLQTHDTNRKFKPEPTRSEQL